MAQMTINIPDTIVNRVLDAMATQFNWSAASGQTKAQFAKDRVIDFIKNTVRSVEGNAAVRNVEANIQTDITLS